MMRPIIANAAGSELSPTGSALHCKQSRVTTGMACLVMQVVQQMNENQPLHSH